ncbi:MAG: DUF4388 domain-containing protein [Myxococcota bacterium]|nr:DUF4388 domain-containing protein [Myxococcota bacterium]
MPALEGELGVLSLSGLLQMLQGERISGRLALGAGHVDLRTGQVVDAVFDGLSGEAALMEIFVKASGRFSLDVAHEPQGESLGDVVSLVMDGCRLQDEWSQMKDRGVSIQDDANIPDWVQSVETELRAGYPLAWIASQRRVASVDLAEAVQELIELGEARLVAPTEPPMELDYWGALELGRERYREQSWSDAARAFQLALDRKPGDRIATQNLHAAEKRARESA